MFKLSNILEYLPEFKKEVYRRIDRKRYFSNTRATKTNLLIILELIDANPELLDIMDYSIDERDQLKKYFGSLTKGEMKQLMHNLWEQNMVDYRLGSGLDTLRNQQEDLEDEIGNVVEQQYIPQQIVQLDLPEVSQQKIQQILQEPVFQQEIYQQQIYQQLPLGAINIEVDFEEGTNITYVSTTFRGDKIELIGKAVYNSNNDAYEFDINQGSLSRRQEEFYNKFMVEIDGKVDMLYVPSEDEDDYDEEYFKNEEVGFPETIGDLDYEWEDKSEEDGELYIEILISNFDGETNTYHYGKYEGLEDIEIGFELDDAEEEALEDVCEKFDEYFKEYYSSSDGEYDVDNYDIEIDYETGEMYVIIDDLTLECEDISISTFPVNFSLIDNESGNDLISESGELPEDLDSDFIELCEDLATKARDMYLSNN